ncbi:hypothetical protein [Rothia uropygialis]|uniref:hypothetical protein n=1 Tax=Kocuria sp. 36 TaxID=1415402 RepID=UPI00101D21B7|nr:hypothetical protein [Kocuria sp. 36]
MERIQQIADSMTHPHEVIYNREGETSVRWFVGELTVEIYDYDLDMVSDGYYGEAEDDLGRLERLAFYEEAEIRRYLDAAAAE